MNFHDLPIADTVVDLPAHDKTGLLHKIAHRAAAARKIDDDIVFNALMKREALGSTGVGNGVAIPHARLEQVNANENGLAVPRGLLRTKLINGLGWQTHLRVVFDR